MFYVSLQHIPLGGPFDKGTKNIRMKVSSSRLRQTPESSVIDMSRKFIEANYIFGVGRYRQGALEA